MTNDNIKATKGDRIMHVQDDGVELTVLFYGDGVVVKANDIGQHINVEHITSFSTAIRGRSEL